MKNQLFKFYANKIKTYSYFAFVFIHSSEIIKRIGKKEFRNSVLGVSTYNNS